jgi:hypothetical protein
MRLLLDYGDEIAELKRRVDALESRERDARGGRDGP